MIGENDQLTGLEEYHALIKTTLSNRKEICKQVFSGWEVTCYKGFRPSFEDKNVTVLEFSAYAITADLGKSQTPEMSNEPRAIRVDFDESSVVTLNGSTQEEVTEKLQNIFSGFCWS